MWLLAVLAVKIFFQHQFAVPRDQNSVVFLRIGCIHWCVDNHLDKVFYRGARDSHFFQGAGLPTVIKHWRRRVSVSLGGTAARIEVAGPIRRYSSEFESPSSL